MKKLFCILLSLTVIIVSFSVSAAAAEGKKLVAVSAGENPSSAVRDSASVLEKYVGQLPGNGIAKTDGADCVITLSCLPASGKTDGSFTIKGTAEKIEITGYGNNGVRYAVYDFLREYGGYHDYAVSTGMRSDFTELDLPAAIDTEYTPAFDYTDTDWPAPADAEFAAANCVNGRLFRYCSDEPGGSAGYISNFCHTLSTEFCSSDKFFSEDPELFALHDGQRTPNQLCLTNEKTYEIVLGEVMDLLKEKHDPEASLQIISLTQHDNFDYCQCPECSRIDTENGSQSGSILTFVNRIAKEVKNAGYDNVAIDTFAYQYSRKAPSKVIPDDNVIIRLCTIECCFAHALNDTSCAQNIALKEDLEAWNSICDNIYVWDYTTDYACLCGIFPDFGVLQSNMQFFKEHGVRGVFEEGDAQPDANQVGFGELRAYLISRLLRDPYCDYEAEAEGFVNAYYGKGGTKIKEFIERIDDNAAKNHAEIFMAMTSVYSLTDDEAAELDKLWEEAKALSSGDTAAEEHINESGISWRYVKSSLCLREFRNLISRFKANSELHRDITAHNAELCLDGHEIGLSQIFKLFPAEDWMHGNKQAIVLYIPAIIMYAVTILECLMIFILGIKKRRFTYLIHLPLLAAFAEAFMWSRRAFLAWRTIDEYFITLGIFFAVTGFVFVQKNSLICSSKAKTIIRSLFDSLIFFALYATPLLTIKKQLAANDTNSDFALVTAYTLCAAVLLIAVVATRRKLKSAESLKKKTRQEHTAP